MKNASTVIGGVLFIGLIFISDKVFVLDKILSLESLILSSLFFIGWHVSISLLFFKWIIRERLTAFLNLSNIICTSLAFIMVVNLSFFLDYKGGPLFLQERVGYLLPPLIIGLVLQGLLVGIYYSHKKAQQRNTAVR
jgi:hypothetical protein